MTLKVSTSAIKEAIADGLANAAEWIDRGQYTYSCTTVGRFVYAEFCRLNLMMSLETLDYIKQAYCKHSKANNGTVGFSDIPHSCWWSRNNRTVYAKQVRVERILAFREHVLSLPLNAWFFRKVRKLLSEYPSNHK